MKRYSLDYGVPQSGRERRPLTRAQAARVVAEPLPIRASDHGKGNAGLSASERLLPGCAVHIAVWSIVLGAWALAWLIAFAL